MIGHDEFCWRGERLGRQAIALLLHVLRKNRYKSMGYVYATPLKLGVGNEIFYPGLQAVTPLEFKKLEILNFRFSVETQAKACAYQACIYQIHLNNRAKRTSIINYSLLIINLSSDRSP